MRLPVVRSGQFRSLSSQPLDQNIWGKNFKFCINCCLRFALTSIVFFCSHAFSAPALVQKAHLNIAMALTTTASATFPGNVSAGNLIVVWIT